MTWEIRHGDCVELMAAMPEASVDAIVTDPPYQLSFMGKEWDSKHEHEPWSRAALRVLKPGGHVLAFGGTRTFHRLTCALEDAGFEIRDCLSWMYGSGFPKSLDVSKAIDKAAGAEREVVGLGINAAAKARHAATHDPNGGPTYLSAPDAPIITAPATDAARQWAGWGTALKPAWEPIILARKPLVGTVAGNVQAHGTGALNVDGCRIGYESGGDSASNPQERIRRGCRTTVGPKMFGGSVGKEKQQIPHDAGRWPANVLLTHSEDCREVGTRKVKGGGKGSTRGSDDGSTMYGGGRGLNRPSTGQLIGYADADGLETVPAWDCAPGCPVRMLDEQSGDLHAPVSNGRRGIAAASGFMGALGGAEQKRARSDSGGASRFFYTAKASSGERHYAGRNAHPTVKPVDLMRWLCRLVTPPGGLVLDPFMGSGSTGIAALSEGFRFLGMEKDPDSVATARRRIAGPLFAEANP